MIQFEFVDEDGVLKFVQVIEVFTHHYTGEMMRRVRIDYLGPMTGTARTDYTVFNEERFNSLLERRVND